MQFRLVGCCLCLVCTFSSLCAAQQRVRRLERLPQVHPVSQSQLPDDHGVRAEHGDSVSFAAGAVELVPPAGWWVGEIARGRDLLLVMSPAPAKRVPHDCLWLAYHPAAATGTPPDGELREMLPGRLQVATKNRAVTSGAVSLQFATRPAIASEFLITDDVGVGVLIRGRHVLVRTEWGILEIHASAPANEFEARSQVWTEVWDSIALQAPRLETPAAVAEVRDADTILGTWKSYRSRLRLGADGHITIVPDGVDLLSTGNSRDVLQGRFEARDDLLLVTWRDGSRLNFRWRARQNDLFLTDHEGQISQLKRLYE